MGVMRMNLRRRIRNDCQGSSCVTNESEFVTTCKEKPETQAKEIKNVFASGKHTNLQKSTSGMNKESLTKAKDLFAESLR